MAQKSMTAVEMLNREFLEVRCRLIDIAAAMDRIERRDGAEAAVADPRYGRLRQALALLAESGRDRAERVQMVFSDEYDPDQS